MNVWKKRLLILLGAVCLSISSVQAESFKEDMSSALPKEFSYTDIAGDYSIQFLGQPMKYHMGQVSFVDPKTENFRLSYCRHPSVAGIRLSSAIFQIEFEQQ